LRYGVKSSIADLCLGIQISRTPDHSFHICQEHYIVKSLAELSLSNVNVRYTPMSGGVVKSMQNPEQSGAKPLDQSDHELYRRMFGKLMYAMVATRPDIAFAVGYLGRYLHAPTTIQLAAARHIFGYLKGTSNLGILYSRGSEDNKLPLQGYGDSDFASEETRKSTTGYVFFVGASPITWCSQLQSVVATSTTEAEYISLFETAKEAVWLRRLLRSLGYPCVGATPIYEDNLSCISLTRDDAPHYRTKHIDVKFHFTRGEIINGTIEVRQVSSEENVADIFTKAQTRDKFLSDRKRLNLVSRL
jgi:hypothetical protein